MTVDGSADAAEGLEGQRVLITGGGGFVGGHLASDLASEADVRVLDDFSNGSRDRVPPEAEVVEGDVRDPDRLREAMAGVDCVFHQAAVVSVERSVEAPEETHGVNVDATLSVLERARETDARVVFASSAAIYGAPESVPITEDAPKRPSSPYGLEKLGADQYCRLYADLYGVETVALRYFNIYGPGQSGGPYSGVIAKFRSQAREGGPITVQGDGSQTRDFVHVSDIVRANRLAATTPHTGEAFNVGTGRSIDVATLARVVGEAAGGVEVVHTDPRSGDIRNSLADVSKARSVLGYEPTVDLESGIEALLADGST
ncbi:NAD-dependent epimerase/dehydratase family protein [Saliphagus sp. LR7]|uniref:NAD-dependent epimerase/dehydratase family protein n=1 Tax=Saliphagus sp. LR7 TaxID=2282654 RepID=UPI000DF757DE|nr:NAD-dependent epimerase/dehydratase family protein [Saliphagus sp. LR7]